MNPYLEGSLEWHAYGAGDTYARQTGAASESPLSGEWAGGETSRNVIHSVYRSVMGPSWDTFNDDDDDVRDNDESILDAWEEGYFDAKAELS